MSTEHSGENDAGYDKARRTYDDAMRWLAVQTKADEMQGKYPDWRRGQALFNALHSMDPELADLIRGTDADPFHRDSRERVQAFAGVVMTRQIPPTVPPTTTEPTNTESTEATT